MYQGEAGKCAIRLVAPLLVMSWLVCIVNMRCAIGHVMHACDCKSTGVHQVHACTVNAGLLDFERFYDKAAMDIGHICA